jgi:hypothetical protein
MERDGFLARMNRSDKYQLSGGRLIFAPRYPHWLERPGWWDIICRHDEDLQPVFAWALLERGREVPLEFQVRQWHPGRCRKVFEHNSNLNVAESQFITAADRAVSKVFIDNLAEQAREFDLVVWTRHHYGDELTRPREIEASNDGIGFLLERAGRRAPFATRWEFAADRPADSFAVIDAECLGPNPHWLETPFATGWKGSLASGISVNEKSERGAVWFALHYHLRFERFEIDRMRNSNAGVAKSTIALGMRIVHPDEGVVAMEPGSGAELLAKTLATWSDFFDGVPEFACSEPLWEHLYRYRWYLIRQCLKAGCGERQPFDGVCEGPDIFHQPISYSTPPIVFDLRWHRDPSLARNQVLNFTKRQEEDGRLPGALFHDRSRAEFFYHADWGRALTRLHELHPDGSFLEAVYPAMARYAEWLARERDRERSGMIDVLNMMETGQEFSSRYIPAKREFDDDLWLETLPIKGVDSTVYYYLQLAALGEIAAELGRGDAAAKWRSAAERTREAILQRMWSPEEGMFSDLITSEGMRPSRVRALTCFYPFLAGITGPEHVKTLNETLLNPAEFWTPRPAATLSRRDPAFSEDGHWRGKMRNCPWNGRVWPMTNSHMVEVLAEASIIDPSLRDKCAELLVSFAGLFNTGRNPRVISSYEHYSPRDGSPCAYRGIDDYLHCWMIDLIIRYVAGFRPRNGGLTIDPFIKGLERVELTGLPLRGSMYDLVIRDGRAELFRDGALRAEGRVPLRVEDES